MIKKLIFATKFSLEGLNYGLNTQFACRLEIFLIALLGPVGFFLGKTPVEKALLVSSLLLIFMMELVNTAIEVVIDRISLEHHELSKAAKDLGSATVLIATLIAIILWCSILFQ